MEENAENHIRKALKDALQGLAFWISYRQVLCYENLINEGALVAELTVLLRARLASKYKISNEEFYDNSQDRMDIGILEKDSEKKVAIIEVKKGFVKLKEKTIPNRKIDEDINKLIKAKENYKNVPRYLVIVSENKIQKKFLDEKGKATTKKIKINSSKKVKLNIQALKSIKTLNKGKISKANYCCLLEIAV